MAQQISRISFWLLAWAVAGVWLIVQSVTAHPPPRHHTCLVDEVEMQLHRRELEEAQAWLTRFGNIYFVAQADPGPALFVSQAGAASRLRLDQYDGGRDAKYIVVSQRRAAKETFYPDIWSVVPPRETLGYHPQVAGTDLIYDLTAEAMQGKARPFECDLAGVRAKVYALLPVQIEAIAAQIETTPQGKILQVEFHDATGDRLEAILLFHFAIHLPNGQIHNQGHYATETTGRFASHPKLLDGVPAGSRVIIRSQLTGQAVTVAF
jgi:hypothetical protein